jgi:hypothetical protein
VQIALYIITHHLSFMSKDGMPKGMKDRPVVPIGERFLAKTGEPASMAEHLGKIPGVTYRRSAR